MKTAEFLSGVRETIREVVKPKNLKKELLAGLIFLGSNAFVKTETSCVNTPGPQFYDIIYDPSLTSADIGEKGYAYPGHYNLADRPQDGPDEIEGWTGEVAGYYWIVGTICYGDKPYKVKIYHEIDVAGE